MILTWCAPAPAPDALAALARTPADVVLLDIRMPGVDGLTILRELRGWDDPPVVAMLTTFGADEMIAEALRAGAAGYLLKDSDSDDLTAAIRSLATGQSTHVARRRPYGLRRLPPARGDHRADAADQPAVTAANATSWPCWPKACPTARSAHGSTSARRRSRTTSAPCWASWARPIGSRPPCSRTGPGSDPVTIRRPKIPTTRNGRVASDWNPELGRSVRRRDERRAGQIGTPRRAAAGSPDRRRAHAGRPVESSTGSRPGSIAVLIISALSLVLRRRWPVPVLLVATVSFILTIDLLPLAIAVYAVMAAATAVGPGPADSGGPAADHPADLPRPRAG